MIPSFLDVLHFEYSVHTNGCMDDFTFLRLQFQDKYFYFIKNKLLLLTAKKYLPTFGHGKQVLSIIYIYFNLNKSSIGAFRSSSYVNTLGYLERSLEYTLSSTV